MNKNFLTFFILILIVIINFGCVQKDGALSLLSLGRVTGNVRPARVTAISVTQNQVIIKGSGFSNIKNVAMVNSAHTFSEDLTIESKSDSQIVANGKQNISFIANVIYDLVLSSAEAASTFSVNFSLCDGTLGGVGFTCTAPNDKEVLSYDATSGKWKPRAINGLNYISGFNASSGNPPSSTTIGDYYIITTAGTISGVNYSVGDWIVYSAVGDWERINNSTAITSVFGRTGAIVAAEGDYNLDKLSDVNLTVAPTNNQVLQYNSASSKWIAGTISLTESDPTVMTFAKTTLPICLAGEVLKSNGTNLSCVTDTTGAAAYTGTLDRVVLTDNSTGALKTSGISSSVLGFLSNVTSDIQSQINSLATPALINLGVSNADKVLITNNLGKSIASGVTSTELSNLTGVTSSIQTQINSITGIWNAPPLTNYIYTTRNVGIGSLFLPAAMLDVNGDALINGLVLGKGLNQVATNTAFGVNTLNATTSSGTNSTAIGYNALTANTTSSDATAIGSESMRFMNFLADANQSTSANTAVGAQSLRGTNGSGNVGSNNTAIGFQAIKWATIGNYNTAIGSRAAMNNSSGVNNTATGYDTLLYNTNGFDNTAIGYKSMELIATDPSGLVPNSNTALGVWALQGSPGTTKNTGSYNTAVGHSSLRYNTLGHDNTAVGEFSLINNTEGYKNTVVGSDAAQSINKGFNNVVIGYNAQGGIDLKGKTINLSDSNNTVVIGAYNNAIVSNNEISISDGEGNERIRINDKGYVGIGIGNTNPGKELDVIGDIQASGCLYAANSGIGSCPSDIRIKKDIHKILLGLDVALGLNAVYYKYNGLAGFDSKEEQMGFIAQEVQKASPDLVFKKLVKLHPEDNDKTEILGVNYGAIIFVAINAIKDLYNKYVHPMFENDKIQDRKIASLEAENKALKEYICEKDPKAKLCQNKK